MDCENYKPPDKCLGKFPTSAAFEMQEDFPIGVSDWNYYDTDTSVERWMRFVVKDDNIDSVIWLVGVGVYNDKILNLTFPDSFWNQQVKITCIVYKKPNLVCFPDDNGVDTLSRYLYFLSSKQSLCSGSFFGYNEDHPKDTFTVVVEPYYNNKPRILISGFMPGCFSTGSNNFYVGYRKMLFGDNVGACQHVGGWFAVDQNRNVTFDYGYWDSTYTNHIYKKFIGVKIK